MREIKFRAWNKDKNKMIDLHAITPFAVGGNVNEDVDGLYLPFIEGIILMQYTGLKDKKGTGQEVYEGDIIDEEGIIIGNVYEEPSLNNKPYLLIEDFGGENWCDTYKEAMDRGCKHA